MYSTVCLQMPHSSLQVPSKLFAEILTSSNWFTSCLCHWYKPSCRTSCETLHRLGTVGAEFSLNTLTSTTAADSRQRLIVSTHICKANGWNCPFFLYMFELQNKVFKLPKKGDDELPAKVWRIFGFTVVMLSEVKKKIANQGRSEC